MKKYYALGLVSLFAFLTVLVSISCSDNDDSDYEPISPVTVDLSNVPYPKLSDYKFFVGEMKNQVPALGVLEYEPISSLFTDYALKKRFVWMPKGTKATYNGDHEVFNFPTGSVIIKTFYYNNVQPSNTTRIIETRLLIKKETGWIFAEYVWNAEQTEATLQMGGSFTNVQWRDENNELKQTNYRIPSEAECLTCHKVNEVAIPIGPKPQNLNKSLAYTTGNQNQLAKWVQMGYLESYPSNITTVVNYKDESQPLELRVRSFVDINCAHCHRSGSHCDYRPIRLAFNETTNRANLGVCVTPEEEIPGLINIVTPSNTARSVLHYRLSTNDERFRMPLIGRNMVYQESVEMIEQWINSLSGCN